MTLWFLLAMMTGAAVFAVLWPLGRRPATVSAGHDVRVYRDQLDEIARDRSAGRIGEAEAEGAKIEVSRRLIAAAEQEAAAPTASSPFRRRVVAVAALVMLPLLSAGLYLALGSPSLPGQPLSARVATPPIAQLIAQVETHLESHPEDGRGWEVLAPAYMRLGRYEDAVRARRNAVTYNGATATRETDLGEALVAAAKGTVTVDARQAFERALALDTREPRARYFLGLAAKQAGRAAEAATIWRDLLASAPPGASWAEFVRDELARVESGAGPVARGPSEEEMIAAAQMDPQQRRQMITGMVEGLAEKLKKDGSDLEGWIRLVRAYTVLGDRDKARVAAADARRAVGEDRDKLQRLDELIKELGLES